MLVAALARLVWDEADAVGDDLGRIQHVFVEPQLHLYSLSIVPASTALWSSQQNRFCAKRCKLRLLTPVLSFTSLFFA